ncbi:hypothetical protein JTB14_002212 [Gonioctena quinquepunctata]|nr:hypothetical protein JTB14_002212 [Gonioctena quinquepunctata]
MQDRSIYIDEVDGVFLIHSMTDVPQTFGKISVKLSQILLSNDSKEVAVVFDRYQNPSVKDYERNLREKLDRVFKISGPDQIRFPDFLKKWLNGQFKENLINFLLDQWSKDGCVHRLPNF